MNPLPLRSALRSWVSERVIIDEVNHPILNKLLSVVDSKKSETGRVRQYAIKGIGAAKWACGGLLDI